MEPEGRDDLPRSRLEPSTLPGALAGALVLSTLCTLAAYLYFRSLPDRFPAQLAPGEPAEGLLGRDLNLVMAASFLCAFVGFGFSRRYGLPGLGAIPGAPRDLGKVVGAGLAFGLFTFFSFDRSFREIVPAYYPRNLREALATIPSSALFTEIVVRFGMMTILTGAFRRPRVANGLTAAFFTLLAGAKQLHFAAVRPDPNDPLILLGLTLTLVAHAILGTLYARKGLFPCIVFHLAMETKYLLCPFA